MTPAFRAALERVVGENPRLDKIIQDGVEEVLFHYWELLTRWNVAQNLSRRRDVVAFLREDVADCGLGLLGVRAACPVVDVGSGAGFPGLLAALLWPEAKVHLVEALRKRASFLRRAAHELGLENVEVHAGRAEDLRVQGRRVLTRATLPWRSLSALREVVAPGGALVAFVGGEPKGQEWQGIVESWGWKGARREYRVTGLGHRGLAVALRPGPDGEGPSLEDVLAP